ncbi:MAG: flavin reductase family protein [Clostridiales Family XIII bacterium]|nr:flavin reductase family protein [Clostridiales Family XIII bacterium]
MKQDLGAHAFAFPTPVYIVGSYGKDGKPNAMNVAWGGICGSEPPCVAISIRKSRRSYDNITEKGAFTVNIPSKAHIKEADYFGIASGHKVDKFAATGLTAVKSPHVDAPYIEEFPLCLACKVIHTMELGQHVQFVGEIVSVMADASCLTAGGLPDIEKLAPLLFDPAKSAYNATGEYLGKAFSVGKEFLNKG